MSAQSSADSDFPVKRDHSHHNECHDGEHVENVWEQQGNDDAAPESGLADCAKDLESSLLRISK